MSEIWYCAWVSPPGIKEIQVERSTPDSIWTDGRRSKRKTGYCAFFQTFDEAREFLVTQHEAKVVSARRQLDYANDRLGNAKGLKLPTGAQP